MSRKVPIIIGIVLGATHFVLVGMPFIESKGGGEAIGYLVLFADLPLYLIAEVAFPKLLLNSVRFNLFWFVVMGTIMYFLIGYGIGVLIKRAGRKTDTEI